MAFENLTDERITELLRMPKRPFPGPHPKQRDKGSHTELNQRLRTEEGEEFSLLLRQSIRLDRDFSCVLMWHSPEGDLILVRCNGSSHNHGKARKECHIHRATAEAIQKGFRAESFADTTIQYATLAGAKHHMVQLANITGVPAPPEEKSLFS